MFCFLDGAFEEIEKDLKTLSNDWESVLVTMARLKEKLKLRDERKDREAEVQRVSRQVSAIAHEFDKDFSKFFGDGGSVDVAAVGACSLEQLEGLRADLKVLAINFF